MIALSVQRSMSAILRSCLVAVFLSFANHTCAQSPHESLHGAHEIFVSPDAVIVWAVLKAPSATDSDKAAVWLRIVNITRKFSHVSIDGVDPFSKKRERVQSGIPLQTEARVESDRDSFSDLPSREVHFYRSDADMRAEKPALTVYYLGVPDQTPEFSTHSALDGYFGAVKLTKDSTKP